MLFNSLDFLGFFIVVFVVQLCLPHRPRNLFFLAASYFFYGCWDWRFLGLMAVSTVIDYICSHRIATSDDAATKRRLLAVSMIANLAILGFFKYAGFFVDSWITLAASRGIELSPRTWQILLPVGISFYTFQTMSYTWDVYRGEMKPLKRFADFALYVAFFPQLVAGPIERGKRLSPQIKSGPRTTLDGFQSGSWLVFKGLFKKAVIADNLAPVVDSMFALESPSAVQVMIGAYAFAFQIYGDFSGYTDIARGVGRMLGYDLSLNFRLPYLATNPSEFWQRWHISLSSWLRDYLYIPLGGNRNGPWMTSRNLMLTMLLGGLWHGAAWTFVIWGAFHGVLLICHRRTTRGVGWSDHWIRRTYPLRLFCMFHLTCLGWLIFRADSLENLHNMLSGLLRWSAISIADWQNIWMLALLAAPLMVLHWMKERSQTLVFVPNLSLVPRLTIYTTMAATILALGSFGKQDFIYFQF
ncbi:MBOAT family protein [Stieleria sp. ICT_E10.1]|uniref:MBOAT family O-acyltransferase n=1 Tax=Stieleria sedimenti TaxID=2976331 RepID=UPI00217F7D86|nr:MBOAT family O-acyltransferase [Stieleria sedimenti]MCS7469426.1 MBOAT family protein [Stieleria sedimenti]